MIEVVERRDRQGHVGGGKDRCGFGVMNIRVSNLLPDYTAERGGYLPSTVRKRC